MTMSGSEGQQAVTNENSTVHFKEQMIVILSMTKNRCTTSTDGWMMLKGLNKQTSLKVFQESS